MNMVKAVLPALRGRVSLPPLVAALTLLLAGCAALPPSAPAAAQAPVTAAALPASAARPVPVVVAPQPGQPQPFATVIRDARRIDGLFTLWQKDDKVWFELQPADFGRPFFFGPKVSQGIGEAGLFGGNMPGVVSQPHPDRKSVLVEANPLQLADLLGLGILLQVQRTLLNQLLSDGVAQRLLDSEGLALQPGDAFHLSELYERLGRDLWSELDARSESAQRRPGLGGEARAHLADVADHLRQALQARMARPA